MPTTLQQLADLVGGRVVGDGSLAVRDARSLHEAGPGHLSFLEGDKRLRAALASAAGAIVIGEAAAKQLPGRNLLVAPDPLSAFIRIVQELRPARPAPAPGASPQASVHPSARLGEGCAVLPFAFIGEGAVLGARCVVHPGAVVEADCRLGDDCVLHPNCVLKQGTVLGARVVVHAGAVLGADGFGYRFRAGKHEKVPQLGNVEVGDDVEIGANAAIDRAMVGSTRIGAGTKIDNLVQVAHNCVIGRHNLLCSQVGIAGSSTTGDHVVMAGQVGIADHVDIGAGAVVGAQSGVAGDVPAGQKYLGYPAMPEKEARRVMVGLAKLPELLKDVRRLKAQLGECEAEAKEAA
ncbi:MAG: UDP-3-O-(3-hydroxymyristoyl)glucosamine N-acyltransferase [Gemmataceae bacterium]|nr:UDP-3-O-(3-hydroxymyristoyl)glucosamine N-acyltransferase [Gemmataceae bacterium]